MEIEKLTADEARVLGTLLEKSLATPDYYPMTLSALRPACNQKTCREPVSDLDDAALSQTLAGLKRKTLVVFIPYGSSGQNFKYRHFLDDARYDLLPRDLAILSVLLLRGAQTLNEIKLRTASQHAFSDLPAVEKVLIELSERSQPLVERLDKRTGWKEPRWRHRLYDYAPGEVGWISGSGLTAGHGEGQTQTAGPGEADQADEPAKASLKEEIATLREEVATLRQEVAELRKALGG